jgi:hypothetical protein
MPGWNDYNEDEARRDPAVRLRPALQLAIEDVKPALISRFPSWRQIPHIQLSSVAFAARMQAVTTGQKARVDFKRTFARFIETRFPDYPVIADTVELFRCVKPLDEHLALGIDWRHRAAWGLGKILEVQVGARWDNKSATSYHPLSFFVGSAEAVSWAYITKEDLEACFDGAAQFLDVLLPLLAGALPKRMVEDADLGGAGPITAREGNDIAQRMVDELAAAADPARPTAGMDLQSLFMMPGSGRRWGAMFSPDGRLRAHGTWAYSFKGRAGEGARVHVPSLGDPWIDYQAGWTVPGELIGEPWMDSTDAMAAIAASGRLLEGVTPTELSLGYYPPYTEGPSWRIDSWIVGKGVRNVILIDARDGHVVWAHP